MTDVDVSVDERVRAETSVQTVINSVKPDRDLIRPAIMSDRDLICPASMSDSESSADDSKQFSS